MKREHWVTTNVYMDAVKVSMISLQVISRLTGDYRKTLTISSTRGVNRYLSCIYSLNLGTTGSFGGMKVRPPCLVGGCSISGTIPTVHKR